MHLELTKSIKLENGWRYDNLPPETITSFNMITTNCNLLFIRENKIADMNDDKKIIEILYDIFKVQFIAQCDSKNYKNLVVAFFIEPNYDFSSFVVGELPNNMYNTRSGNIIDYHSYTEICDITGEVKLSLSDYIKKAMKEEAQVNFISHPG
ncbi:MAG: hypothetical protein IPO86_13075 [Saprospiraceae bacterium]|nr:hypothetical protein [Saprospiraceae bacterium]